MRRWLVANTEGDADTVMAGVSEQPGVLAIGTDSEEWWHAAERAVWRRQMEESGSFPCDRATAFGLALRGRGWRVVYLGADTPLTSVTDAAHASASVFSVVSAVTPDRLREHRDELHTLARNQRLCLGGAGTAEAALDVDVEILSGGPVEEAERVTALLETR